MSKSLHNESVHSDSVHSESVHSPNTVLDTDRRHIISKSLSHRVTIWKFFPIYKPSRTKIEENIPASPKLETFFLFYILIILLFNYSGNHPEVTEEMTVFNGQQRVRLGTHREQMEKRGNNEPCGVLLTQRPVCNTMPTARYEGRGTLVSEIFQNNSLGFLIRT